MSHEIGITAQDEILTVFMTIIVSVVITARNEILASGSEVVRDTAQTEIQHIETDAMAVKGSRGAFSRPCSET